MLTQIYTSTKIISYQQPSVIPAHMSYIRDWDALVLWNYQRLDKIFRDASQCVLASSITGITNAYYLNRIGGRHAWARWTSGPVAFNIYGCDNITGLLHDEELLNPSWKPLVGQIKTGSYVDDFKGYLITGYSSGKIRIYNLENGFVVVDIDIPGGPNYDNICYVKEGVVVAIHHSTGKIAIIDYYNFIILFQSGVGACLRSAYDCLHNIFITLQSDKKTRVYTMDVVPSNLLNPEFIPSVPHQHRLMGSLVRTKLTGSYGGPCEGWCVDWEILGAPPKGWLQKTQSGTDKDGYAWNYYFGPRAVGEIGSETIKVTVKL
jgi:hypothetical protein